MTTELQLAQLLAWVRDSLVSIRTGAAGNDSAAGAEQLEVYNRGIEEMQKLLGAQSQLYGEAIGKLWGGYRAVATKHYATNYVGEVSR
jgi:hypothetical protein